MKLIKQLNEVVRTSMDRDTFARLVDTVTRDVQEGKLAEDNDILELIYMLIENIPGYEDVKDAAKLANRVFKAVKKNLADPNSRV